MDDRRLSGTVHAPHSKALLVAILAASGGAAIGLAWYGIAGAIGFALTGLVMLKLFPRTVARIEQGIVRRLGLQAPPMPALSPRPIQPPAVIIRDAALTGEANSDGNGWVWSFTVSLTIAPSEDDKLLIAGDDCEARVTFAKDEPPIMITLRNVIKNDGPPMPSARIDDPAALVFASRLQVPPWSGPLPTKVLARITLADATHGTIELLPLLLIQPKQENAHWVGHGNATDAEIAEFAP